MPLKQFILASLLVYTSLLAAAPGNAAVLYFPDVATTFGWQTEIAIINTSTTQSVAGTLRAFSNQGLVDAKAIALSARGRRQINVASEFINPATIGSIIFDANCETVQGYAKLYKDGVYRMAIPAVKEAEASASDIYIPYIVQDPGWTTSVSLLNTTTAAKELTITFNNGQGRSIIIAAGAHGSYTIQNLYGSPPPPDIRSAVITNAGGIIGLVFFSSTSQMDGVLVTDKTASTLYYPHVVADDVWWTGIVIYNPSASARDVTISPYDASGIPLGSFTAIIPARDRYYGTVAELGLPAETAWFRIDSPQPITGL
jgi:hypothetical protein